ncbi:MAG: DNA translocase FtsK 4TM domain-containing protein [candidate division Zixibacteria bacterium]|nr:DNA translocase FtsK 4TM domain-containing protein [candidate division Zixibacteria bacterium]
MVRKNYKSNQKRRKKVLGVLLLLLAVLLLISLVSHKNLDDARITGKADRQLNPFEIEYRNQGGMMGAYLSYIEFTLFGWLSFFVPIVLILLALRLFSSKLTSKLVFNCFILCVISLLGTIGFNIHIMASRGLSLQSEIAGGYLTEKLTLLFVKLLGELGSYVVLSGFVLMLLILYVSITPLLSLRLSLPGGTFLKRGYFYVKHLSGKLVSLNFIASLFSRREQGEPDSNERENSFHKIIDNEIKQTQPDLQLQAPGTGELTSNDKPSRATGRRTATMLKSSEQVQIDSIEYSYPDLEFLQENPQPGATVNEEELTFTARMLKETLETFGVRIEGNIEKFPGPIITRYEFKPAAGVKINQIVNLSDDLALALKAQRIRIIAPIPGKAAVGVEIPNRNPQTVCLRDILASETFVTSDYSLPLALGKTTSGKPFVTDLKNMPHLLIAGATGSGKSVCMNALITSLLYRLHPLHVRFILIDPKMLELSVYSGIPHLCRPVVTKPKRAERVLTDAVTEMERRYRKLAEASVRNIEEYNKKQDSKEKHLPYIVIFIDELADMMMSSSSSKTELLITRLAQMSRAVGIHLILATQRPSVDVITGLIKANFPARIAFQVSSKVDSRTIIDSNGAEKLLGHGDMLFLHTGRPEPVRIHGSCITSKETDTIVSFIKDQGLGMFTLEGISQSKGEPKAGEIDFGDPLFREACEVVVRHKQGSVSLLQRRLGIGYQRAARLIDKLEKAAIVSPFDGSKARDVMVDQAYLDTLFGNSRLTSTTVDSGKN